MNCPTCNAPYTTDQKFCTSCGTSLIPVTQDCEVTYETESASASASATEAVGAGMLVSDYHHAKEDLAAANETYDGARKQIRNMIIVGIIGAFVSSLCAEDEVTVATLLWGIVVGWGLSGVFGFMRNKGYFIVLRPIFLLCIFVITMFVAVVIGVPLFLYDIYQLKKAKDGQEAAQSTLDSIIAKASSMGVSL